MKKTVSLLLVLAIVFSLMAGMGITSDAATAHSQAEAVSWANSQVGKSLDYDGVYGAQCVDLIKYYYKYLGVNPVTGNGSDYSSNSLPSGWSRIKYYSGFVAQPGDVAVWSYLSSSAGHVGIVTSANSSGMNLVDQNGATAPAHVVKTCWKNYSNGTFYGVIRPDFSGGGTTKTPANLGNDFYAFIIKQNSWRHLSAENGNVQISPANDSSNPKQIWHFIRQSNGSYKIVSEYDSKCMEAVNFGNANGTNIATYGDNGSTAQRWYIYKNENGYNLSPSYSNLVIDATSGSDAAGTNIQLWTTNNAASQRFAIYGLTSDGVTYVKPSKPSVKKPSCTVSGKTVTIKWNASSLVNRYDNRVYDVRIYKNNTSSSEIHCKFNLTGTSYTYTLSDPGVYYASVAAVNTKYYAWYTISDATKFEIKATATCTHSYTSKITTAATCTANGIKTFTCSKCANSYTQSIAALGHDYKDSITKAATCTEKGVKTFKCSRCTSSYTQDIAALGHNWVKSVQPACIEYEGSWDGYSETKCNRCSASSKKTIPAIDRMILSSGRFVYTGSAFTPSVKVVDTDGKVLKKGNDYKVTYQSGRKAVGSYWVKFTFMGNYQGEITQWFKIVPKGTSLAKLTAGKKAFTAKWKKLGGITGYQIQYSANAKFTGAKTVTIKGATAAGKAIKNLKAKQVYYVRVRTYKTVSGTHYMSNWSKTYKVKTK